MHWLEIFLIGISLALDAFAVAIGTGTSINGGAVKSAFCVSLSFGFFQFLMPVLGWSLGIGIEQYISQTDHWIAFGLLFWVGARMIIAGFSPCSNKPQIRITYRRLFILSVATSIDALVVGIGFGLLGIRIWTPSILIGLITFVLSLFGFLLGQKLGACFGKKVEIFGGAVLIMIGGRILMQHIS